MVYCCECGKKIQTSNAHYCETCNNKCELCNERQSTLTIEDNEGLTLRICKNCFESEYGGEDIEWMH